MKDSLIIIISRVFFFFLCLLLFYLFFKRLFNLIFAIVNLNFRVERLMGLSRRKRPLINASCGMFDK